MASAPARPWVVLSETETPRWGGDLRRAWILRGLAARTSAVVRRGRNRAAVGEAIRAAAGFPWPWRTRPWLATSELLTPSALAHALANARPAALDVHDEPLAQAAALGVETSPAARAATADVYARNVAAFPVLIAPSASFATLAGLDPGRVVVAPNGSDVEHVRAAPFPAEPAVGFVSGAAPARGIETLVAAVRRLRIDLPEVRLLLWLAAADESGLAYLAALRADLAAEPWIEIGTVAYGDLSGALARATVLAVPHPPGDYLDVAVPVKLLDSMAAGRPVAVTPRAETRRIVEAAGAGVVAADDSSAALAAAIEPLLRDAALARRLGAAGRAAVERDYDWRVISDRAADAVLGRLSEPEVRAR